MFSKALGVLLATVFVVSVFAEQGAGRGGGQRPPLVAVQDPTLVHAQERIQAKKFSSYGVEMGSVVKLVENGKKLADYRATITLNALKKAQAAFQVPTQ